MPISLIGLLALLVITGAAIGYRKMVADSVDDFVHVADESTVAKQESVAKSLTQLDRVVKILVTLTVVYALAVAGLFGYRAFNGPTV